MTKFKQKCERVADQTSVEVWFHPEDKPSTPFQDDGMLHICGSGLRAVFFIGQDCGAKAFNAKCAEVMAAMGKRVSDRVLEDVGETEPVNEWDNLDALAAI